MMVKDTGQLLVSGMGELHLEIIKDRILNHYKVGANVGKVMISYRGTFDHQVTENMALNYDLAGKRHSAKVTLTMSPGIQLLP
jgi:elongation factor G